MNDPLQALMHEATRLTRAGRLNEATHLLQRALGEHSAPRATGTEWVDVVDEVKTVPPAPPASTPQVPPRFTTPAATPAATASATAASGNVPPTAAACAVEPGSFTRASHTHGGLTRDFKLYLPPGERTGPLPLVVMLHGCKQNPDDFAAGTAMNRRAAEQGFIVLYPAQAQGANPAACWNWFKPNHQQRGRGEPALIASLTQAVMKSHGVDPRRVYVAGLSAGGAMAAVLGQAYPELFAAVGVHSGLPSGAAHDVMSALAAMKSGTATGQPPGRGGVAGPSAAASPVPTIVFHGDQDATVHPRNGDRLVADLLRAGAGLAPRVEPGVSDHGRRFTRTVHRDLQGVARVEHWQVHGAGHAWSGGDAGGSYTDPRGPDASREMLRFFFQHLNLGG
jgi:poly(hydroxyalkanoate) depolymerase family esterase